MSGFFLIGSVMSVATLAATGSIDHATMVAVAFLIPAPFVGFGLSLLLNRVLDPLRLRWTAIGVSCFGAVLLIVQQLF